MLPSGSAAPSGFPWCNANTALGWFVRILRLKAGPRGAAYAGLDCPVAVDHYAVGPETLDNVKFPPETVGSNFIPAGTEGRMLGSGALSCDDYLSRADDRHQLAPLTGMLPSVPRSPPVRSKGVHGQAMPRVSRTSGRPGFFLRATSGCRQTNKHRGRKFNGWGKERELGSWLGI